jgi:hypothetical protein
MFNTYLIGIIGTLALLFAALIGWIGVRLHNKVDTIDTKMAEAIEIMRAIERDLRGDFSKLDRRVTRIEDHPALASPPLVRER